MVGNLKSLLLLLACCSLGVAAEDAAVGDPTRPPAAFVKPQENQPEAGGARLRSIKIPHQGGRPSAVIDGKVVRLGESVGDSRLVRLTATEATLKSPTGKETLSLTPEVTKTMRVTKKTARQRHKEKS